MQLLTIVQNYPPERGPVRYTSSLCEGLASRGHDVRVITGLPHYPEGAPHAGFGRWRPRGTSENGVAVTRVPLVFASNAQPLRRMLGMATFGATSLPPALRKPRPDVVIASVPPIPVGLVGFLAATAHRVPLVILVRDVEPKISLELRGLADRSWARAAIRASAHLYDRADRLVVVHDNQTSSLTDYGIAPAKIETIRHGIDVERFEALARRSPAGSLPRRGGRLVLLYLGTLGVAQDVDVLARAFARPEIRALPVDLLLIGGGERTGAVERVIREERLDNVSWQPPVPLEDVPALLSSADALITSYRTTDRDIPGMIGSKLYEYCAAGKPILVHGTGVAADLVETVGNGWHFSPGDIPGLERALRALLESPVRASEMGIRGRNHARTHFSLSSRQDRWEQMLADLVSETTRSHAAEESR